MRSVHSKFTIIYDHIFEYLFLEKACKEKVGDEERRDPTPSSTDDNDGDDELHCEPVAELPTTNNNTNNSITEFQRDTETIVTATTNNNGNTENGVITANDNHDIEQIDSKSESNDLTLRCNEGASDHHKE
jgi:hypothetical protein